MAWVLKQIGCFRKVKFTEEEIKAMDNGTYNEADFEDYCYYCKKLADKCDCGNIDHRSYCQDCGKPEGECECEE